MFPWTQFGSSFRFFFEWERLSSDKTSEFKHEKANFLSGNPLKIASKWWNKYCFLSSFRNQERWITNFSKILIDALDRKKFWAKYHGSYWALGKLQHRLFGAWSSRSVWFKLTSAHKPSSRLKSMIPFKNSGSFSPKFVNSCSASNTLQPLKFHSLKPRKKVCFSSFPRFARLEIFVVSKKQRKKGLDFTAQLACWRNPFIVEFLGPEFKMARMNFLSIPIKTCSYFYRKLLEVEGGCFPF